MQKRIPKDSRLIQESLQKVAEGPESFMKWATEHREEFDQKFFNFLDKTATFFEKSNDNQMLQTIKFLQNCFQKVFDLDIPPTIAVTEDNYRSVWKQACDYLHNNKPHSAVSAFEALRMFFVQQQKHSFFSSLHSNLGLAYLQLKSSQKAIQHLQKALELSQEEANLETTEKILVNLASIHRENFLWSEVIEYTKQGLEIAQQRQDSRSQVQFLQDLAHASLENQQVTEAFNYQQQAVDLAAQLQDRQIYADALTRLGLMFTAEGDAEKAQAICEKALLLSQEGIE